MESELTPHTGSKPKRPFLKRGEGVQRRIFAPKQRQLTPITDDKKQDNDCYDISIPGDQQYSLPTRSYAKNAAARQQAVSKPSPALRLDTDDGKSSDGELKAETTLVQLHANSGMAVRTFGARFKLWYISEFPIVSLPIQM